ncbi:bifunctional tetrahydrofolate synthase/dihydrofolate synthase [Psychrobacter aestuarii]|uniref:Dihydrofolate synthase/folylpolyglutamate synthase n=1 Tax=Psychrobacter aestuarii TaxID=556327 RepID=A0ABP3FHK3_9GAMM|nr:bifunctional tetrahydrofolate synthase/dihydrofolate synthase [Psychrobacter aestuarii]
MSALSASPTPTAHSDLGAWLDYIYQIHVSAIDMGLSRVTPVAQKLGLTSTAKKDAYVFTVAGTNGKGSTTATIAAMCQAAGYKTALYQSPHLIDFNERVRIDGQMVSDAELIAAFAKVDAARAECDVTLSFFEMTTLAAFLIFAEAHCDVWVLEVGLGGRLDVVNIIDPDMAVITNIGIDHVDWLGDNVESIGAEKAGILRDGIPLIFGSDKMPKSVQARIDAHQSTAYQAERDYTHQVIDETTWQYSSSSVTLRLPRPTLSLINTTNALSAVLASPLDISTDAIEHALQTVRLAGRFDNRHIAGRDWVFDVAHNEEGVRFLLAQLVPKWQAHVENKPNARMHLLFSMLMDKDINTVVTSLKAAGLPIASWYVAPIDHPRAAEMTQLVTVLDKHVDSSSVHTFDGLPQATAAIIQDSHADDLLVACGSFHTISEALTALSTDDTPTSAMLSA